MTDQDPKPDAAGPLQPRELEWLARRLAEELPRELTSFDPSTGTWLEAARGVIRGMGAVAHLHFEEHEAPDMLTFTFRDVVKRDPRTGAVLE